MKGKNIKRLFGLLLIAVLLLQVCGCAASKTPEATNGSDKPAGSETPNETDPPVVQMRSVDLMADITPLAWSETPADVSPAVSGAVTDFALRLFRAGSKPGENTLISPLSVLCALSMTANGAKGETLSQMERTLGLDRAAYNEFFRAYLTALAKDDKSVLNLANAIWFTNDTRFTVNRDFLQTNADYYGADVYKAPFDDTTCEDINSWVKEKTDGMIPEILDEIPPEAVMYLVNAVAFDAKWQSPYDKYSVQEGTFKAADGSERKVDFMYSEEHAYLEDENAAGFLKYYEGGRYAFAALLPREGMTVDEYLATLDGAALQALLAEPRYETVYTSLPKFESEWSGELSELLESLGMTAAFDARQADFTDLGVSTAGNVHITRVLHKTYISVAEDGTRAGAATAVEMCDEAAIENPKQVYLDRPFVYMLVDCETGIPFFIGTMADPRSEA